MLVVVENNQAGFKQLRKMRTSVIGQLVLVLLGLQMFFFASFVALSLPTATEQNQKAYWTSRAKAIVSLLPDRYYDQITSYCPAVTEPDQTIRFTIYTPEAPVAVFLGYVLGFPMATIAAALYLLLGLLGPNFGINALAAGGGLDYYTQPSFGYLIGMIVSTFLVGRITAKTRSSITQVGAVLIGVFSLHVTGLLYMLTTCIVYALADSSHLSLEWQPWVAQQIRNLSWYQLPYDLFFSAVLVALGFPFKWLVRTLTLYDTVSVFPPARK